VERRFGPAAVRRIATASGRIVRAAELNDVAGVFGALTVSRRILLVQAAPAALALAAALLAGR
jgi:uncharacterized membrane protein